MGEEVLLALEIRPDPTQALADVRLQARVDEGDPPVAEVAAQQLDPGAALGEHEVVRERLVVVEEVLLITSAWWPRQMTKSVCP